MFLLNWAKKSKCFRIASFACPVKFHQEWFWFDFSKSSQRKPGREGMKLEVNWLDWDHFCLRKIPRSSLHFLWELKKPRKTLLQICKANFQKNTQIKFTLLVRDKEASSDMESKLRMSVCWQLRLIDRASMAPPLY